MLMDITYSRMIFAESLLPDGQSIIEQVCCLFIFVLIPDSDTENDCCYCLHEQLNNSV